MSRSPSRVVGASRADGLPWLAVGAAAVVAAAAGGDVSRVPPRYLDGVPATMDGSSSALPDVSGGWAVSGGWGGWGGPGAPCRSSRTPTATALSTPSWRCPGGLNQRARGERQVEW